MTMYSPLFHSDVITTIIIITIDLSVAEMHRLYVEKYVGGVQKSVVKYHYNNKVFNENSTSLLGTRRQIPVVLVKSSWLSFLLFQMDLKRSWYPGDA